jgi:methyl-accepting chemotaxis protein
MALKNFLLTGNRDYVGLYEDTSAKIDAELAKLETMILELAPDQASSAADLKSVVNEWRTTVVDRQIQLMRDPLTVELARVLELTGEGAAFLEQFKTDIGSIAGVVQERALVAGEEQRTALSGVVFISLAASVIVAIVAGLMGLLNFRLVSRPLSRLADATARLANGDLDVTIDKGGKDEIGKMAESMQVFREAAIANKQLQADAEANRQQAEADRIAAQEKAEADAAERLKIATSGLATGLQRLAAGDLSFQLEEAFAPDFEALRHDFNKSVRQLSGTMASITESVSMMETGTREIANGTDDLSKRTERQAAALEETAAAVEEITANVSTRPSAPRKPAALHLRPIRRQSSPPRLWDRPRTPCAGSRKAPNRFPTSSV